MKLKLRLTSRRRREILLLPSNPEKRRQQEEELDRTLDALVMKFAGIEGWAVAGGYATAMRTGSYHRMLEEIEVVVWDHAFRSFIERAEEQPRAYTLMSRKTMNNIPFMPHQVDSYIPVNADDVLDEIEKFRAYGLPCGAQGKIARITNRNLRLILSDCLEHKSTPVHRDNSIDVDIMYEKIEQQEGIPFPQVVCPDTKFILPSSDVFITPHYHYPLLLNMEKSYLLPLIGTPFLLAKYAVKDHHLDRFDTAIIQKYHKKLAWLSRRPLHD